MEWTGSVHRSVANLVEMILSMRGSVTGYYDGSGAIEGKGMMIRIDSTQLTRLFTLNRLLHTQKWQWLVILIGQDGEETK